MRDPSGQIGLYSTIRHDWEHRSWEIKSIKGIVNCCNLLVLTDLEKPHTSSILVYKLILPPLVEWWNGGMVWSPLYGRSKLCSRASHPRPGTQGQAPLLILESQDTGHTSLIYMEHNLKIYPRFTWMPNDPLKHVKDGM